MLSQQAVVEYQQIFKKVYGEEINTQAAMEQGERLLRLFKLIYRPVTKKFLDKYKNKNENSQC